MSYKYYMPTKVVFGQDCIHEYSELFSSYGKKAMIVSGKHSSKINGSQDDVSCVLEKQNIEYIVFDKVMSNPTTKCCYEGAKMAKEFEADFLVAIGGGSPMDAAKAIALLAKQEISEEQLLKGAFEHKALPVIAVPTTAGTGSEVTQYAILTNDLVESKTGVASEVIFPKIAFVDSKYMRDLSVEITINTAIDALSHAVEGILSIRSSILSDTLAQESIKLFSRCIQSLNEAKETHSTLVLNDEIRDHLAKCSTLAGMVIAQTGTTVVHAMGYSLTYFKEIDHGRANGLLLAQYLKLVNKKEPELIDKILHPMGLKTIQAFSELMDTLLGGHETMRSEEIRRFSEKAVNTGNMNNCRVRPTQEEIVNMFNATFLIK